MFKPDSKLNTWIGSDKWNAKKMYDFESFEAEQMMGEHVFSGAVRCI